MTALSAVSFLVNVGMFALLSGPLGMPPEVAAACAVSIVMVINFLACRYWVFEASSGKLTRQFVMFLLATLAFRSLEIAVFSLVYRHLGINELLAYVAVLSASFVLKFAFYDNAFRKL